ncbi:MAG: ParB N-terminal domain-containing protein [Clostridiales bacterium]|nr:ParB N-terminal domain-containing protein [Clostridiales bacterium]
MEILEIPIEKINPAEYNPRVDLQPDDVEYKQIEKSINEFGCVEPLVWNKQTGNLVSGHQRLKILIAEGAKAITCSVVDLDPNREKALNIALNKISGKWVDDKLASIFAEFENSEFNMPVTGFSDSEISNLIDNFFSTEVTDDNFDADAEYEAIEEAETKPGDIWQLGKHKLFCGDATGDLSVLLDGGQADMLITDPPYNVDYTGKTSDTLKITNDNLKGE